MKTVRMNDGKRTWTKQDIIDMAKRMEQTGMVSQKKSVERRIWTEQDIVDTAKAYADKK